VALNEGLFPGQDQQEQDFNSGAGWTIDQQKPAFFDNVTGSAFRGIGQGAADGLALLTHGVEYPYHALQQLGHLMDPSQAFGPQTYRKEPWQPEPDAGDQLEAKARAYSKSLMPDPRVTGTGANLVQGLAKSLTEFGAGAVAGGPVGGAALLGTSEGYAHYYDLKDQGVDDDTAASSALLAGSLAGGGALLPMSLPARWLSGLTLPGTYLAQAGAGAAINTSFGLASRYAQAKILEDAGYPQMAEQMKPMDSTSLLADAISGLFFGAHAAWYNMKATGIDPSVRDAAKVVQDSVTADTRAPGVPVDMKSAATHREALETALGDLMANKPVDLNAERMDGAKFARPEEDTSRETQIIRDAFTESGLLNDAAEFDRWLSGEREDRPQVETPKTVPEDRAMGVTPPSRVELPSEIAKTRKQLESESPQADVSPILASRPDLEIADDSGQPIKAADELAKASDDAARADAEAEPMHAAAINCEGRHL
jgi:hypothetical protein